MFIVPRVGPLLLFVLLAQLASAAELRVPENYVTLQAAIDAAAAGDTVVVEPGTYTERVVLKANVTLRSEGDDLQGKLGLKRAEATIIDGGKEQGSGAGVEMAEGATLDGFTIRNVGIYDDNEWKTHHASQGDNQLYEHIGAPGVVGIAAVGATCEIRNNIVYHIGDSGIGIVGVEGKMCSPLVENNVCYRNMGAGIGSMNGSRATIRGNTCFENFYAGIGHSSASPLVVNNVCYGNVRAGIGISDDSSPEVRRNKCYRNRRAGIGVRTGSDTRPLIEDNDCYENEMAGIGVSENAAPTIRKNRCYRNKLAGIGVRTRATPRIIENECFENEESGIGQMGGTETVLIGNYLHQNNRSGIGFASGKDGKSHVENNRVIDNALVAVGINPGWTVDLVGNELSRKDGLPPIVMVFAGSVATFKQNVIRGGGVAGIRVAGTVVAANNRFHGTALRKVGPPNFAIWGLKGSTVVMTDNEVTGWRHALHSAEGHVNARRNSARKFHRAVFVIEKPASEPIVSENEATTASPSDQICLIDNKPSREDANKLIRSDQR
ncbi:right-handed parallel beta-helix repeat-containing protein [Roseiconus nitratireducens]|uniref:Right-handed parallel beta-helix repeat-containing protein n=1 Tax=Roseiconus nitratireducens TaxID=2605748 RepID=A0A5M6D7L0_9BACT|nr:right-handed parallel beta-helix repeat-containing protein [Roseiconus nitratireducens]KAA5542262.1 right-handed parallel beta-helix repeat-containing protein [Roseiconus nitratireducens]